MTAILLGSASCSSDIDEPITGGPGNVQLSVQLPAGMATRAFNDGTQAKSLTYAVYEAENNTLIEECGKTSTNPVKFENGLSTTVNLQLANGKKYYILFWADKTENSPYTFSSKDQTITVEYKDAASSDDSRDAFYAKYELEVNGPTTGTVELKRPFAQINLGTNDLNAPSIKKEYGEGKDLKLGVGLTVTSKVANVLNLKTGEVSGSADVTFSNALATVAMNNGNDFPYTSTPGTKEYDYISMDYILVGKDRGVVDLNYAFNNNGTEVTTLPVTNVPVQANYQTNIFGSLLTSPATLQVVINPAFEEPDYNISKWDGVTKTAVTPVDNVYSVASGANLAWLMSELNTNPATFEGKTVELTGDIDMGGHAITSNYTGKIESDKLSSASVPFKGVLDGKGHTVKNLTIKGGTAAGDIVALIPAVSGSTAAVKNLNFENVNINATAGDAAALIGVVNEGATVDNVNVLSGSVKGSNKVAGIVSRVEYSGTIKNCVNKADITAGNHAGGICASPNYTKDANTKIEITSCKNYGNVTGAWQIGGVVGETTAYVTDCHNYGNVTGSGNSIGGVAGELRNSGILENCSNEGTITGTYASGFGIGGVVGWIRTIGGGDNPSTDYPYSRVLTVKGCTNKGNVIAANYHGVGGIIGEWYRGGEISGNSNTAEKIQGGSGVAGICGCFEYTGGSNIATTDKNVNANLVFSNNNTSTTTQANVTGTSTAKLITYSETIAEHITIESGINNW